MVYMLGLTLTAATTLRAIATSGALRAFTCSRFPENAFACTVRTFFVATTLFAVSPSHDFSLLLRVRSSIDESGFELMCSYCKLD